MSKPEPTPEPLITSITSLIKGVEYVRLLLNKNCRAAIRCEIDDEGIASTYLTLSKETAKEILIHLCLVYGMEDWEVGARLTKEQFQWLQSAADKEDMTQEDYVRKLIQDQINKQNG